MAGLPALTPELASRYAALALAGVEREWPHAYQHVASGADDLPPRPRRLHPAFYGCFDWHSAVHSHWALARLRRLFPQLPPSAGIERVLSRHLTSANLAKEAAYFRAPARLSFERPYGWGWLLALAGELRSGQDGPSRKWSAALRPLETLLASRFIEWLPRQRLPLRAGVHGNTAFGLSLAFDYARATDNATLQAAIARHARSFYLRDVRAPAQAEPNGDDFLSGSLAEADLMRRVLPPREFLRWWRRFLPRLPPSLRAVADPGPHRDGKSTHLDGLNLSRAWAMRGIAHVLPPRAAARRALLRHAARHAEAGLARVFSGDYAGEHWLASFAVYLLSFSP
jgi:hypothetical protein